MAEKNTILKLLDEKLRTKLSNVKNDNTEKYDKSIQELNDQLINSLKEGQIIKIDGLLVEIKKDRYGSAYTKIIDKKYLTLQNNLKKCYDWESKEKEKIKLQASKIKEKIILHGLSPEIVKLLESF